jgi:hypothetical protein
MLAPYLIVLVGFYYFFIVGLGIFMFLSRTKGVQQGRVDFRYFKTYDGEVPNDLKVIENNFNNQFQLPVIFMITCLAGIQFNTVSTIFFSLACLFVISRMIHSYVHITSNKLMLRAGTYFSGVFMVAGLWLLIMLRAMAGIVI